MSVSSARSMEVYESTLGVYKRRRLTKRKPREITEREREREREKMCIRDRAGSTWILKYEIFQRDDS